jgi:hypothetical protein
MKIRILFLIVFTVFQTISAQTLSPNSKVSVLTIGPGSSLNDAFGHNVFRVYDPINNIDLAYDYGRFPFNEPGFYLNFAQGKLNYSIGRSNYRDVKDFYIWQDRTITEQVLNISTAKKQAVYEYLKNNYKPENREYLYDFFYDNCATKIKDVLKSTLNDGIVFNESKDFKAETFRKLIQQKLNYNTWGSVGIDIALGSVIDQTATPEEHMFLPEYIHSFFSYATLGSTSKKLIEVERKIYEKQEVETFNNFITSPLFIFILIAVFIVFVTYKDFKKNKRSHYLDALLLILTGIIGVFLLLLWFATDHTATAQNYNLLWAFPLNLILFWKLKQNKPWIIKFLKFLVIMICLMAFHWIVGIQVFAPTLIPLVLALLLRYLYLIKFFKEN